MDIGGAGGMVLVAGWGVGAGGDVGEGGGRGGGDVDGEGEGGDAGNVGGAGRTGVSDTCSRFRSAGDSTGGEAVGEALRLEGESSEDVGEALRLEGEGGDEDGSDATPDRGERWNTSSSSCPRSSSTSFLASSWSF